MAGPQRTLIALAFLLLAGCTQAASAPAVGSTETTKAGQPASRSIPSGATLIFAMNDVISTKSAHAGDPFSARLVSDFTDEKGAVVLSSGAILHGTVTESVKSPSNDEPALVRLQVGTIETASGTLLLDADVQELQMDTDAKDSNTVSGVKVAAGAAAGAVIGKIAGKTKTGAAVGTAAGVALALATKDGDATIPAGSRLVVRLNDRLAIR